MVTERRQHWDDELIETVKNAIFRNRFDHVEGPLYDQDVFPVIAAVEDWAEWEHVPKGTLARIERVKGYCERRREDRGGDLTALDVLRLLRGTPIVGDLSSQADDGQRLDVNSLLSAQMEQHERAEKAEKELHRGQRLLGRSLEARRSLNDALERAEAAVQRVRGVCATWRDYDPVDRAMSPHLLTISKDEAADTILRALDAVTTMSECRPHWDDELIDAVAGAMSDFANNFDDEDVWAVIAAVEDWQSQQRQEVASALRAEVDRLRAQVQAVLDARHGPGEYPWHCSCCAAVHALDGGDDE